ncbi:probable receptor-like protein kinase At1g11050 [Primulina eburnea]|uniref:probable receptor-like protein kinase At1g11050 n=1 Tax=Primulina eburnea TaxID=1245227 RepID=UPI003C6C4B38
MGKFRILFPFLVFFINVNTNSAVNSSCPIDFTYVQTFPWDSSLCHEPAQSSCCQTLHSVFGMGLAQYLKQTSTFYLPDVNSSSSCIANFEESLAYVSVSTSLFASCFNDTGEFVNRPSTSCAGIITTQDWTQKVRTSSPLESSCNGDLTGLTRCGLCLDAGLEVNSYLVSLQPNSTKCFFFTILYAAAIINDFGPEDPRIASCIFGIPLYASKTGKKWNNTNRKLVFGFVGGFVGFCFAVILFLIYRNWEKRKRQDIVHEKYVSSVKSRVPNTGAKWFHVTELEHATNGFSQKNMIGQGGYGIVYKGTVSDGTEVAIKQILDLDSKADDEFANEAEIISMIRHRNLLALKGFCVTSDPFKGKRRYLVCDFMSNGSLDEHLFSSGRKPLSWPQRKNIILDVAKGLAYLHYGIKPAIYHRDIKATNILLDSDMKARVADFGLAKQSTEGQSHLTTRVAGTYGYLAPEYALYGQLTEKSDVYSFGILILEIMSGRRVLDASEPSKILITDWAWALLKSEKVEDIFHASIINDGPKGVMERFVLVGILSAHVMVSLRPTIADALKMLEGDIDIPRLPERPLPLSHHSFQTSLNNSMSTNEGSLAMPSSSGSR